MVGQNNKSPGQCGENRFNINSNAGSTPYPCKGAYNVDKESLPFPCGNDRKPKSIKGDQLESEQIFQKCFCTKESPLNDHPAPLMRKPVTSPRDGHYRKSEEAAPKGGPRKSKSSCRENALKGTCPPQDQGEGRICPAFDPRRDQLFVGEIIVGSPPAGCTCVTLLEEKKAAYRLKAQQMLEQPHKCSKGKDCPTMNLGPQSLFPLCTDSDDEASPENYPFSSRKKIQDIGTVCPPPKNVPPCVNIGASIQQSRPTRPVAEAGAPIHGGDAPCVKSSFKKMKVKCPKKQSKTVEKRKSAVCQDQAPCPPQPCPPQPCPPQPCPPQPCPSQPCPPQPCPSQPCPPQPCPPQPCPPQPYLPQPCPSQPCPSQPSPSQPCPPQPYLPQPCPSQPCPSQPSPSQPCPPQPCPKQQRIPQKPIDPELFATCKEITTNRTPPKFIDELGDDEDEYGILNVCQPLPETVCGDDEENFTPDSLECKGPMIPNKAVSQAPIVPANFECNQAIPPDNNECKENDMTPDSLECKQGNKGASGRSLKSEPMKFQNDAHIQQPNKVQGDVCGVPLNENADDMSVDSLEGPCEGVQINESNEEPYECNFQELFFGKPGQPTDASQGVANKPDMPFPSPMTNQGMAQMIAECNEENPPPALSESDNQFISYTSRLTFDSRTYVPPYRRKQPPCHLDFPNKSYIENYCQPGCQIVSTPLSTAPSFSANMTTVPSPIPEHPVTCPYPNTAAEVITEEEEEYCIADLLPSEGVQEQSQAGPLEFMSLVNEAGGTYTVLDPQGNVCKPEDGAAAEAQQQAQAMKSSRSPCNTDAGDAGPIQQQQYSLNLDYYVAEDEDYDILCPKNLNESFREYQPDMSFGFSERCPTPNRRQMGVNPEDFPSRSFIEQYGGIGVPVKPPAAQPQMNVECEQVPSDASRRPAGTGRRPASYGGRPVGQRPPAGANRTVGTFQRPTGVCPRPPSGANRPGGAAQRPARGVNITVTGAVQRPTDVCSRPSGRGNRTVGATSRPSGVCPRPAGRGNRSVGAISRPGTVSQRPSTVSVQSEGAGPCPPSVVNQSAGPSQRPSRICQQVPSGVNQSAGPLQRPSRICQKVPSGVNQSAGPSQRPSRVSQRVPSGVNQSAGPSQRPSRVCQRVPSGVNQTVGGGARPAGVYPATGANRTIGAVPRPTGVCPRAARGINRTVGTMQRPGSVSQRPSTASVQSEDAESCPPSGINQPAGPSQYPTDLCQQVPSGVNQSVGAVPRPKGASLRPTVGANRTVGAVPRPTGVCPRPTGRGNRTVGAISRPSGVCPRPPSGVNQSVGGGARPAGVYPATGANRTIGTVPRPTGVCPRAARGINRTVGTMQRPGSISQRPSTVSMQSTAAGQRRTGGVCPQAAGDDYNEEDHLKSISINPFHPEKRRRISLPLKCSQPTNRLTYSRQMYAQRRRTSAPAISTGRVGGNRVPQQMSMSIPGTSNGRMSQVAQCSKFMEQPPPLCEAEEVYNTLNDPNMIQAAMEEQFADEEGACAVPERPDIPPAAPRRIVKIKRRIPKEGEACGHPQLQDRFQSYGPVFGSYQRAPPQRRQTAPELESHAYMEQYNMMGPHSVSCVPDIAQSPKYITQPPQDEFFSAFEMDEYLKLPEFIHSSQYEVPEDPDACEEEEQYEDVVDDDQCRFQNDDDDDYYYEENFFEEPGCMMP